MMNWKLGIFKYVAGISTITVYAVDLLQQQFSQTHKIIHTKMSAVMISYKSSGEYNQIDNLKL
jgi:malic enzyme